jgi:hypothetical protein
VAHANPQVAFHGFETLLTQMGQILGQALVAGVQSQLSHSGAASLGAAALTPVRRGPGRPPRSAAEAACLVPNCGRRSVAKKLCATHYRKAARLHMHGTLTDAQLAFLARDGRAVRWENAAKARPPRKVARAISTVSASHRRKAA